MKGCARWLRVGAACQAVSAIGVLLSPWLWLRLYFAGAGLITALGLFLVARELLAYDRWRARMDARLNRQSPTVIRGVTLSDGGDR